jgi:uncharacterized protein (DUF4415 family)
MSRQSKTNWDRIEEMKDEEIDYSDIPPLTAEFFAKAVRWPGPKELISLRLDQDVLSFFRRQGKGYQTTINLLLRRYMEAQSDGQTTKASLPSRRRPIANRQRARKKK